MTIARIMARCMLLACMAAIGLDGCDTPTEGEGTKLDSSAGGQTGPEANGGSGGSAGSGGASSSSGSTSSGGSVDAGGAAGGQVGTGGVSATGGRSEAGGSAASGGTSSSGGVAGTAGRSGSGGRSGRDATGTGGTAGADGTRATGGAVGAGGTRGTGGVTGAGGSTPTGGATAQGTGGRTSSGGATGAGGSAGPCTPVWGDPPSNVAAWIDASWNEQLGANVKNRKDWLLDSVIMGEGQINLCVRWGATSAPSASVKANMASSADRWFNDWFSKLDGYGCFPYSHITVKVTGWAVKPGNESWVSDLDSSIKVYTETDPGSDPKNEPKCPDACSFFTNWTHTFPNCPGGEAFHHDYWIWLDDNLPGGGAAAVGGDWGLRMPASSFINTMGKSSSVIEHEMGHGFGFQDYYDWPASSPRPEGGSLMIVGSSSSQTPTVGDQWLLRRTWEEMTSLRGW
jgi:hypothetical protein